MCARLPSTGVGPSGLRARRGVQSRSAVASCAAISARRRASLPCRGDAPAPASRPRGPVCRPLCQSDSRLWLVRFCVTASAPYSARRPMPLPGRVTWLALATVCPVVRPPLFVYQAPRERSRRDRCRSAFGHVALEKGTRYYLTDPDCHSRFCGEALGTSAALCTACSHRTIALYEGGYPLRPSDVAALRHTRQSVSAHNVCACEVV